MEPTITLENLAAEIAHKKAELEELETLYRLSQKYLSQPHPQRVTQVGALAALAAVTERERTAASFGTTKKDRILNASEFVLSDGKRRISRELLKEIATYGIEVGGEDAAGNLASYLSRERTRFVSDVKLGGWTLKKLTNEARPEDAATSTGLSYQGH